MSNIKHIENGERGLSVRSKLNSLISILEEMGILDGYVLSDLFESKEFEEGTLSSGFVLRRDEVTGRSYMEIDELFVRLKATFTELEIQRLASVGGQIVISPANMTISKVVEHPTFYRCYFEQEDETRSITNDFVIGDQVRSQSFNIKEGTSFNVINTYYWRLVIGVGVDYIDLSIADCDTGSTSPEVGDAVVLLGNRNNVARQNAIVLSAYGAGSPSITQYAGINSYSLVNRTVTKISPSGNTFTGDFYLTSGTSVKQYVDQSSMDLEELLLGALDTLEERIDDDLEGIGKTIEGINTGLSGDISDLSGLLADTDKALGEAKDAIETAQGLIDASKEVLDELVGTVESHTTTFETLEDEIVGSVKSTLFNPLEDRVEINEGTIRVLSDEINLEVTSDNVETLLGRVVRNAGKIQILSDQISLTVDSDGVDTLLGKVTKNTGSIQVLSDQITLKVDEFGVDTILGTVTKNTASIIEIPTQIDLAVKGITIGGTNLLKNSDKFVVGATGTPAVTREVLESGELKITTIASNIGVYIAQIFKEYATSFITPTLKDGDDITVSMWIKAENPALITAQPEMHLASTMSYTKFEGTISNTYRQLSFTRKYAAGTFSPHIIMRNVGVFYISSFQIEKGNKATSWSPAPEDVDGRITSAESSIKILAGEITLSSSSTSDNTIAGQVLRNQAAISVFPDQITSAVNSISIGARNLLLQSAIYDRTSITANNASNTSGYPITKENLTEGSRNFVRVRRSYANVNPNVFSIYNTIDTVLFSSSVGGREITISFAARASVNKSFQAMAYEYSPTVNGSMHGKTLGVTTEWKRFSWTFTPSITANAFRFISYMALGGVSVDGFYLDIAQYQVEFGNKATDWKVAPEDLDLDITNLGSRVDQTETDITQLVTKETFNSVTGDMSSSIGTLQTSYDNISLSVSTIEGNIVNISQKTKFNAGSFVYNESAPYSAIVGFNTNIPLDSNMYLLDISGYYYGSMKTFDAQIVFYHYGNAFTNIGYTNEGNIALTKVRIGKYDSKVSIELTTETGVYYTCLDVTVKALRLDSTQAIANGWTKHTGFGTSHTGILEVPRRDTLAVIDLNDARAEYRSGISILKDSITQVVGKDVFDANGQIITGSITSIVATTDSLTQQVKSIQVGGVNLLNNSGNWYNSITSTAGIVETIRPSGWNSGFATNGSGGYTIDSTVLFKGNRTLKTTFPNGLAHPWITIENGVEYTYSAMAMSNVNVASGGDVTLHLQAGLNNVNTIARTIISFDASLAANTWKRIYVTFKLTGTANSCRPFIYNAVSTATIWLANIQLERGNRVTDWTQSLSDQTLAGNDIETRVKNSEIQITPEAINLTVSDTINTRITDSETLMGSKNGVQLLPQNWTVGNSHIQPYNFNQTVATENYRINGFNHLGQNVVLWECRPSGDGAQDGGWITNNPVQTIDPTRTYRYSVFVKKLDATGAFYLGCGGSYVCALNTTTLNNNPYFYNTAHNNLDVLTAGIWHLVVGYVFPYGSTGNSNIGEIWNCSTGERVKSGVTCFNHANVTTAYHRCYHYYNVAGTGVAKQWMWNPRIDLVDGNEPYISDLIGFSFETVKSGISITANTITIGSKNILLTGAVTFQSLDSNTANILDTAYEMAGDALTDVGTALTKVGKALAITDKFGTTVDGGLISTVTVELRASNSATVTAGISGLNSSTYNPAFWAGGTYAQALGGGSAVCIAHNGSGWLANRNITWTSVGDLVVTNMSAVNATVTGLTATNATVTGTINATSGLIKELTVDSGGVIYLPAWFDRAQKGRIDEYGVTLRGYTSGSDSFQKVSWEASTGGEIASIYSFGSVSSANLYVDAPKGNLYLTVKDSAYIQMYGNLVVSKNILAYAGATIRGGVTHMEMGANFYNSKLSYAGRLNMSYDTVSLSSTTTSAHITIDYSICIITSSVSNNAGIYRITGLANATPTSGDVFYIVNANSYNINLRTSPSGSVSYSSNLRLHDASSTYRLSPYTTTTLVYYGGYWYSQQDYGQ